MTIIFVGILVFIGGLSFTLEVAGPGTFLPTAKQNLPKREFETFALVYTVVWIAIFGGVVVTKAYESFTEDSYMALCVSLSLPFLLQPILYPMPSERNIPLVQRYSFKANVWIAIFSFIGNYWYTHYFYSVLEAKYTFPSWRLNDVPIPLYFATHFYFVTYHTFSNLILRKIETRYVVGLMRSVFFWSSVVAFSYFTAFMETLTISSFPCYAFARPIVEIFTKGSAFYGLYFLASFPVFFRLDEYVGSAYTLPHSLYSTVLEALGCSMIVLCLLDFCRIYLHINLTIDASRGPIYLFENECSFASEPESATITTDSE